MATRTASTSYFYYPSCRRLRRSLTRSGRTSPYYAPHLDKLLPHLPVIAPYAQSFKKYVRVSANADILLFYFGWILRIKGLRKLVLKLPFLPWFAALMVRVLPRRPVRGRTWDYQCSYEDCDVVQYEARLAASERSTRRTSTSAARELPAVTDALAAAAAARTR